MRKLAVQLVIAAFAAWIVFLVLWIALDPRHGA